MSLMQTWWAESLIGQHPQRFRAALPRSPSQPAERAQKDFRRAASAGVFGLGAGAVRFDPVTALYLARPLAVRPAPSETGSFSPRPTDRLGDFFGMVVWVGDGVLLRQKPCSRYKVSVVPTLYNVARSARTLPDSLLTCLVLYIDDPTGYSLDGGCF